MEDNFGKKEFYQEEELNLKKYLDIVFRKRKILFSIIVSLMILNFIYIAKKVPLYKATSLILIETPDIPGKLSLLDAKENVQPRMYTYEYYNTQLKILKSLPIANRVCEALNLKDVFKSSSPESSLKDMIHIESVEGTRLARISIVYKNSEIAATIANKLVDIFIEQNIEDRLFMSKEVLKVLSKIVDGPEGIDYFERQTAYGQMKELSKEEMIETLPSVAYSPVLQKLKTQKSSIDTEIFDLRQRYKEKHPKVVALDEKLKFVENEITMEKDKIIRTIKADLAGKLQINNIRVIEYAKVPDTPVGPTLQKQILYAFFMSTFLGIGTILIKEYFDDSVKNQEDVENKLDLPYLGHFPLLSKSEIQNCDTNIFSGLEKNHETFEAIRHIRTNIIFSGPREDLKIILFTSAIPREGKSLVASYLGLTFAKNGEKTLLLDADIRKPTIHIIFDLKRSAGLTDVLIGNATLESAIKKTSDNNLYVMTAGSKTPNPLELLSLEKTKKTIQDLFLKFDRIIIDSSPAGVLSDALVLSELSDMTVIVTKAGAVHKDVVKKLKARFNASNIKTLASILNFFVFKEHANYHSYRYYHQYYKDYYSDESAQCSKV